MSGGSKKERVTDMFNDIAPAYDRLNHILSFGIDRSWRRRVVKMLSKTKPAKVLDIATGTGDLALAIAGRNKEAHITGADISAEMLRIAKEKTEKKGLTDRIAFLLSEAENIPLPAGEFDAVSVAFGVRNFHDIEAGLREMRRMLKPGGKVYILEFSTPQGKIFGPLYRFYFHRVLPVIGGFISKNRKAYQYLPESVDMFPSVNGFIAMMEEAGFSGCETRRFSGGIAWLWVGTAGNAATRMVAMEETEDGVKYS